MILVLPSSADTPDGPGIFTGSDIDQAVAHNSKIQNVLRGRSNNHHEALLEILKILNRAKTHGGTKMNLMITNILKMAVEFAQSNRNLEAGPLRDRLYAESKALLIRIQQGPKQAYVIQFFDAFWFWTPDQLDFFAHKIRNDHINPISSQVMYALSVASEEQRKAFFEATKPWTRINPKIRWFILALAYQYGAGDEIQLIKALRAVDPENIRPVAQSFPLSDKIIPNSLDLYQGVMEELKISSPCVQNLSDTNSAL